MSNSRFSIATAQPCVDPSPRVEGSGTSLRYEFRSFDDLVYCLERGTFVLDLQVKVSEKFETDGKVNLFLKGRYSDHGAGSIYCALKRDMLEEKLTPGALVPSLQYNLLETSARNYNQRKETEDTQEVYSRFLKFLEVPMSVVRAKYFPEHSESLHIPKFLKFKMPKGSVTKRISKEGGVEQEIKEDFSVVNHVQGPGKLMVRLNSPWLMEQKNLQNMMMGVALTLARWKYLTDEEKAAYARRREEIKREEEKMLESKRKREEKKQTPVSSDSGGKRHKREAPPASSAAEEESDEDSA
jgi:hypothetical protein